MKHSTLTSEFLLSECLVSERLHLSNASTTCLLHLNVYEIQDNDDDGMGVMFSFILSVAVFISITFLLGWHVYLVLTAQVCNLGCLPLMYYRDLQYVSSICIMLQLL